MLFMYRFLIGIVGILAFLLGPSDYRASIRQWQGERNANLRSADSWLTLVGLFWLHEGDNSIGSGADNDFVLPKGSAPAHAGVLTLHGSKITFKGSEGAARSLSFDDEKPDVVRTGSVSFFVIKRGEKFGVRAKDSASPVLKNFTGLKYFPINPELHFAARLIAAPKKIPILNILGQTDLEESPGVVEFSYRGQAYRLRPIYEGEREGKTLFFLYKDPTNRNETYQAGRMLNTPLAENGKVDLDFNRSYNPPCTFTPYATCPLPPKENSLAFAVTAGELRYGKGHAEYTAAR